MKKDRSTTFIGAGRMGGSLIKAMIRSGIPADIISACDKDAAIRDKIREKYGVETYSSGTEAVERSQVVVLSVKPQHIKEALEEIRESITKEKLVISIAAGVSTAAIEERLLEEVPVIRVMPNSPAYVKASMSALSAGKSAGPEHMKIAREIFDSAGKTVVVDESLQNAVTALSGSGPAYFYLMVEALTEAGVDAGMDWDTAFTLAHETMFGASRMLKMTGKTPYELIDMVKSPGGTTEAAMRVLEEDGLKPLIRKAFNAALKRAGELEIKD